MGERFWQIKCGNAWVHVEPRERGVELSIHEDIGGEGGVASALLWKEQAALLAIAILEAKDLVGGQAPEAGTDLGYDEQSFWDQVYIARASCSPGWGVTECQAFADAAVERRRKVRKV